MEWFTRIWSTSIGKKFLMGLTGLALVGFLLGHIFGNMHIFWGAHSFNNYADGLHQMKFLLPLAEIGLLAAFIVHIVLAVQLSASARAKRGVHYKVDGTKNPGFKYTSSKLMVISGLVVLTFIVIHIIDFRIHRAADDAAFAQCVAAGVACDETLAISVRNALQVPWRAVLYTLGSLFIGWHLFHGIQSAARSFGIGDNKWTPVIEKTGTLLSVVIGGLFAVIAVALFVSGDKLIQPERGPAAAAVDAIQIEALGDQEELTNTDRAGTVPDGIADR